MCFLKKVIWGNMIARRQKPGVISGHPYADCKMFKSPKKPDPNPPALKSAAMTGEEIVTGAWPDLDWRGPPGGVESS